MSGPKRGEVVSDSFAVQFRSRANVQMKRLGIQRAQLITKMCENLPARSKRWVESALGPSEALPVETAIEISLRLWRLGVRLPDSWFKRLYADRLAPAIIVFPGESERLAAQLDRIASIVVAERREHAFAEFFKGFEGFNQTEVGRRVINGVRSELGWHGDEWRFKMQRFREPLEANRAREKDGKVPSDFGLSDAKQSEATHVVSIPKMIDVEFRPRYQHKIPGKTAKASGAKRDL